MTILKPSDNELNRRVVMNNQVTLIALDKSMAAIKRADKSGCYVASAKKLSNISGRLGQYERELSAWLHAIEKVI